MRVPNLNPGRIFRVLHEHRVRYVLIGGLAATLHGSPLVTQDADICPDPTPENLARLAEALRELDARVSAANGSRGIGFDISAEALSQAEVWNLITDSGRVDLSFRPAGTDGYADLKRDAISYEIVEVEVPVASLGDVIRSKEAAGRERDRLALPTLRAMLVDEEEGTR